MVLTPGSVPKKRKLSESEDVGSKSVSSTQDPIIGALVTFHTLLDCGLLVEQVLQ